MGGLSAILLLLFGIVFLSFKFKCCAQNTPLSSCPEEIELSVLPFGAPATLEPPTRPPRAPRSQPIAIPKKPCVQEASDALVDPSPQPHSDFSSSPPTPPLPRVRYRARDESAVIEFLTAAAACPSPPKAQAPDVDGFFTIDLEE